MTEEIRVLIFEWHAAKEAEKKAIALRRSIEERLVDAGFDGPSKAVVRGSHRYRLSKTVPTRRKVDKARLIELATTNGLQSALDSLFRWTPSLDAKAWDSAPENIKLALSGAIETSEGRPSFSITITDLEK